MVFQDPNLNQRDREILRSIIHSYLMTAEAVSSKILVESFKLNISSATVRNIMARLERLGYIQQPHTSAGRVPTDFGYRFYVQHLIKLQKLSKEEEQRIDREYFLKKRELNFIAKETSRILSNLTNYTGIVSLPSVEKEKIKEIKLVRLDDYRFVLIVICSNGVVKDQIITLINPITDSELNELSHCLNLFGNKDNLDEVEKFVANNKIYKLFLEIRELDIFDFATKKINDMIFEGRGNLANYPEFRNYEKLSDFLRLLDEKIEFKDLLEHSLASNGVNVYIGKEDKGIEDCSIITSSYKIGDENVGVLGVIGPKRMAYSKVISAVDYIAKSVSDSLTHIFKH